MSTSRREFLATSIATTGLASGLAGCLESPRRIDAIDCPAPVPGTTDARLGFVGDVMLGRSVNERWEEGPPAGVWGSTAEYLQSLDGLFLNLECCLSNRGQRRPGRTYYFRADPDWSVPALEAAETSFACLANNHVLDYGPIALDDTRTHLSAAGIAHAGAGPDRDAAIRPAIVEINGITIAVIAFTDQAPSYVAGGNTPGTAYIRIDGTSSWTHHLVTQALEQAHELDPDLVVASLHWGPNWEAVPRESQRTFARWLVDRGVDIVHGHSAHVIQGVEVYRGRPIIYDAGDFVDDYVVKPRLQNDRSFCFEVQVTDGRLAALRLVPVEIANEAVHQADEAAAAWLRERMRSLSEQFETTLLRDDTGLRIPLDDC